MSYLEPALPLLLLLGLAGVAGAWRTTVSRQGLRLAAVSLVGIWLLGSNWMAWAISLPLEYRYARAAQPAQPVDAIVVLSGFVERPTVSQPYPLISPDTYRRLAHGAWLYRHWRSVPILVCGGPPDDGQEPMAVTMQRWLEADDIPREMIWVEGRSQSTHENAVYGAEVLRRHGVSRVALVVEANSMPRASAAFEHAGIHVVPAPIRFAALAGDVSDVVPGWRAMARVGEVVHESLGLLWYRLRGWA
jgi:uncharacterized SAM-binding protein YcdF (DUF218 family)